MKIIRMTVSVVALLILLAATGHAGEIQVFKAKPDRPYRVVGTVEAKGATPSSRALLTADLKQQAAALGADAIMDVQFRREWKAGHGRRVHCPKGQHKCHMFEAASQSVEKATATAIKYKDE